MFASDVVIILIIFFGVSFILFGKEKNVKKDSKILDIIMNIIIYITVIAIFFPWVFMLLFYNIWFFSIACYSILSNFYTFSQSHVYKLTM
ncbi:hypothetical protein HMPREF1399_00630 [Helicobacter pylori GAM118Bi]|nr:hypothetical protein HMPREF1399_00630 [Helicobacter pylori GAM118Bi]